MSEPNTSSRNSIQPEHQASSINLQMDTTVPDSTDACYRPRDCTAYNQNLTIVLNIEITKRYYQFSVTKLRLFLWSQLQAVLLSELGKAGVAGTGMDAMDTSTVYWRISMRGRHMLCETCRATASFIIILFSITGVAPGTGLHPAEGLEADPAVHSWS